MKSFSFTLILVVLGLGTVSCQHAKSPMKERLPQSVDSPSSPADAVLFLGEMMSGEGLSTELRNFNRQAITLCWQNPAWKKLTFKSRERETSAKTFLCNVPLQFRLCHTGKFLAIENEFAVKLKKAVRRGQREDLLKERERKQTAAFNACDQKNVRYLRSSYHLQGGTLNTLTNERLLEAYKVILWDRQSELSSDLQQALVDTSPSRLFQISDEDLRKDLDLKEAIRLVLTGFQNGVEVEDVVELIFQIGESKLKDLLHTI